MLRVDGNYLYQLGSQIHPLLEFTQETPPNKGTTLGQAYFPLLIAEGALEPLLARSVFQLSTSQQVGQSLLATIREIKAKIEGSIGEAGAWEKSLEPFQIFQLSSAMQKFEAVFSAEMALVPLYVVTPKGGYDKALLIDSGVRCFPTILPAKVPEAVPDINQATRCIAFELPTAAGFHFHRANESVLRRYWDCVTEGKPRPTSKNIGDYLKEMDKINAGDAKVKSALRDLKDLHRNPLIHPEHSLETVDEAIALMNGVHNVMVHMLTQIPLVVPEALVGSAPTIGGPSGPSGPLASPAP